jgi:hypothetical protein
MLPGMSARPLASALAITGFPSVLGLSGESNAGSPTTKFDVTASRVMTVNQRGKVKVYNNVGTKTVDLSVIGIGGRDQTAAFSAFAEPNIFYVPDGKGSVGLILSLNDFITGPNGFPEFTPVMNHKLNGGAQFYQGTLRGRRFKLNALLSAATQVSAAFPNAASYGNFAPSKAANVMTLSTVIFQAGGADAGANLNISNISASASVSFPIYALAGQKFAVTYQELLPTNSAMAIYYGYSGQSGPQSYFQSVFILGWESGT